MWLVDGGEAEQLLWVIAFNLAVFVFWVSLVVDEPTVFFLTAGDILSSGGSCTPSEVRNSEVFTAGRFLTLCVDSFF